MLIYISNIFNFLYKISVQPLSINIYGIMACVAVADLYLITS